MTITFKLIEEPFIPCVRPDAQPLEYGLREVLLKAHEIAELHDGSPLVTVSLHRLLLAILHRCYQGPKNSADRVTIRKAGCFDSGRITRYFEQWTDHFDLFHEKFPFYQLAGYAHDEPSSANRLVKELSRGNNAALFDHTTDEPPIALTPAQAARAVIAEQVFAYSAGRGRHGEPHTRDAPSGRAAAVFALGNTLFETLWLNLTIYNGDDKPIACDEDDSPIWERTPVPPNEDSTTPRGYLDFLTWQSRKLRLHPETAGKRTVVRRVSYSQGRVWEQIAGFYDPFAAYERVPDVGDRAVQFRENRDLWRDSGALFQFGETDQFRGPTCLHTLGSLVSQGHLPAADRYRLMVAGAKVESGQPKLIFWRHETLPLPLAYLDQRELVESLKIALKLAERVGRILKAAVYAAMIQLKKDIAATSPQEAIRALDFTDGNDRAPKRRPDLIGDHVKALAPDRDYWAQLERRFRDFISSLAKESDSSGRTRQLGIWFYRFLAPMAEHAFASVTRALTKSQRDLHAIAIGERYLIGRLRRLGKKYPNPDNRVMEAQND